MLQSTALKLRPHGDIEMCVYHYYYECCSSPWPSNSPNTTTQHLPFWRCVCTSCNAGTGGYVNHSQPNSWFNISHWKMYRYTLARTEPSPATWTTLDMWWDNLPTASETVWCQGSWFRGRGGPKMCRSDSKMPWSESSPPHHESQTALDGTVSCAAHRLKKRSLRLLFLSHFLMFSLFCQRFLN